MQIALLRPTGRLFLVGSLLAVLIAGTRAAPSADSWSVPMHEDSFEFAGQGHRFEAYRGRDALFLEAGRAWVNGSDLRDGTIEFDVAINTEARAFSGVLFRGVDQQNSEHFYIRHHLSGKPDASQYTPVYNGLSGWQIYAGAGFTAAIDLTDERWMHVRLDINGDRAAVYLDSNEPSLIIDDLQRDAASGRVGLNAGNAHFSNVTITPGSPTIPAMPVPEDDAEEVAVPQTVDTWQVSNPFDEASIADATEISADTAGIDSWTDLDATHRGIANLARLASPRPHNTVVAAVTLRSDGARVARAQFGFSDRVRVFLNGRLLYAGSDGWLSRDYRFLGTMGLFDEVALPLEDGDNELWFAVSENFGGWGITAAIAPTEGITVIE
jgi:hypothetical protein